ncbi:uncharacterized protein GGS22DRAFT_177007 [Annulohypoxylon maeteangense]|uniref:uncharacterized protein n=1 Tax=Annulohypoxylon maeteangense TaxID=1927788 RepID=UPI0020083FC5|nr:uncharacterized protein GGS22DRAFT_177007 [Annulohypoxylon maeteangense]KAI0889835.1 hypothetical protein GGS22DRAFT_177007 [Annulohypoxylon maeteangense]
MTFREASQSPPRHSTHHRRRHHQPRDGNKSYQVSNDRSCLKHSHKQHQSDLAIGNSNRSSQPHFRFDIVENWLAQTARQSPHSCPRTSQGHRREDTHSHHPSRPLDSIAPYNKHPRHVDPKWSPRHGFPSYSLPQSASPFQDLGMRDPRKSRRRRITPSDSSFISGFRNSTRPPDHGPGPIPHVRKNIPPTRSPREAGLAHPDASSISSHVDEQMNFERRPRHKTREDKYETKKTKRDHEKGSSGGYEEHRRKKRKKAEKRKSIISSKNIVNNFTSDAVLNSRITVQPQLKPGLFENRRTSKKQPISDLAFSQMQFMKHQKRNPQPKPLSKSRLREKRREGREIEEVSSFFLPHGTDRNTRAPRGHDPSSDNGHQSIEHQAGRLPSIHFQELSKPSPSDHRQYPNTIHISQPHDETAETLSLNPYRYIEDGKDSGKSTEYFTWSTSHHSPRVNGRANSSSPDVSGSVWTTTPEPVRKDLIATGIYRDTGIPLYDDRLAEQNVERRETDAGMSDVQRIEPEDNTRSPRHEFNESQKVKYRDRAIMTENSIKRSGPPLEIQKLGECRVSKSQEESHPQVSQVTPEVDRQKIVRDTRLTSPEKDSSRSSVRTPNLSAVKAIPIHQTPDLAGTNVNQSVGRRTQEMSDPVSGTSRDVMPPPPIPHERNNSIVSSHANKREVDPPSPRQTSPLNITEPESLHAHHIGSCSDVGQTIQGLPVSCNQTTLSSESTVNNERILSSFDTASWIPQRTPSARIAETRSIISRTSMKSPFYVDQYERALSRNSYQKNLTKSQEPESMAEFIARIENESQQHSPLYDDDTMGSEFALEKAAQGPPVSNREFSHQRPLVSQAYGERQNMYTHLNHNPHLLYTDLESSKIYHQGGGEYHIEAQNPQCDIGIHRSFPDVVQPLGDFEEEPFEMSNFWRPNQFSRF